jgi:hypothetical protein
MGEWIHIHICLTLAPVSLPPPPPPGERVPYIHWIGGWEDPRASLDNMEKLKFLALSGLELRSLGRPALGQLLYRLRYRGSYAAHIHKKKL